MSYGIVCKQVGCKAFAEYRFTWPGKDESHICEEHSGKLRGAAGALGLHVQLIPLTPADHAGHEGMKGVEEQKGGTSR